MVFFRYVNVMSVYTHSSTWSYALKQVKQTYHLPSGKLTVCYWTLPIYSLFFPLNMVIFHSYVSLPEGMFLFHPYFSIVLPIGSMYAIYGNIYHQYTPNVSIYTIHGSYGPCIKNTVFFGLYLPQLPAGCAFRRRIHLRPHRFRTTAIETVRRTCWKNVGKMLGKCWKNVGKMLEKCWKNVGKMLGKCWKNVGKLSEKCWKNVGKMLKSA